MKCPSCKDTTLSMSERNGIEIDYCPNCRGVWLDRGELDKLIEKTRQNEEVTQKTPQNPAPTYIHTASHPSDYYKYKKRKSFLEDLFD